MTEKVQKTVGEQKEISPYEVLVEDERRPRAKTCEATIKEYAEFVQSGGEFPPIVVFYDGESYLLADGEHRLEAYKLEGRDMVTAIVYEGGRKDALIYALGSNAEHGLRRTNTDKRKVVTIALTDLDIKGLSDNQVSKMCKVSQPFVSKVKKELITEGYEFDAARLCADGRTINTSSIGRNKQTEPVISDEVDTGEADFEGDTSGDEEIKEEESGENEEDSKFEVDAGNDPPSEEVTEKDENLEPENENQEAPNLNEGISEDDLDIDDAESEKSDSVESDFENDSSLEKETEPEVDGDDSNALDNGDLEEDADQADDAETGDTSQENDNPEDDPEIDSDAATNNGDTVSNDTENSDLGAIDNVDTLKSMIVQLRACNKEQEDQIAGLEVQVAALQEQVTSLETNNEYLTEELGRQTLETMA